jgi:hypothetical protein
VPEPFGPGYFTRRGNPAMGGKPMTKYTRTILTKVKKFAGKADEVTQTINFEKPITLTCRNNALELLDLLESDWAVSQNEPLDALRRFIKALPEAKEGAT